jgi:hypothetical protein
VLLMHPNDEADRSYESVAPLVGDWIRVDVVLFLGFPFLASRSTLVSS